MKKLLLTVSISMGLLAGANSMAATVTHGSLVSNDTNNTIQDSLNNYEWLRLDVLAPLTYSQTLDVLDTQDGGGWSIAGYSQASMFVDALLSASGSACTLTVGSCGNVANWADGDFGANFNSDWDYVWYLTDTGYAGFFAVHDNGNVALRTPGGVLDNMTASDSFSSSGSQADTPITWLVYRAAVSPVDFVATSAVPVPAAVWLFGSGLLGLVAVTRRRS